MTTATAPAAQSSSPARTVKLAPLVALIFFSVSGGAYGIEGLFPTSGPGTGLLLLLVTPLVYSVPHAMVCAELGTAIPVDGGYYHWVRRGLGRFWGFQQGMLSWLVGFVDLAVYPVLFTNYLQSMVGWAAPGKHVLFTAGHLQLDLHWFICLAVITACVLINLTGTAGVGTSSVVLAVVCLAPLLLLSVAGFAHALGDGAGPATQLTSRPDQSLANAFGAGLFLAMWNYSGWDDVSAFAGEIDNSRRNLPRALALSLVAITAGYLLPALVSLTLEPDGPAGWRSWHSGSFSDAGEALGGPLLRTAVTVGGMLAAAATFCALLTSSARVPSVLAQDGYFPSWVARTTARRRVPVVSLLCSSAIYALFCLSSFTSLIIVDVFLTNITLLLEVAALIALRVHEPDLERPYRIPGGPIGLALVTVSLAGVCAWAAWQQYAENGTRAVTYCLVALAACVLLYPLMARRRLLAGAAV
ncbi:APC family permease [Kitasatospora sp. NPDC017646]|uniref:APC family permease n=1 Tax=Kitasatospora sp. NPDC017646 TaxID=3364024 RepID=UPI00378BB42A